MLTDQLTYLVFGIVLVIAVALDLGILSKKSAEISIKKSTVANFVLGGSCTGIFWFRMV